MMILRVQYFYFFFIGINERQQICILYFEVNLMTPKSYHYLFFIFFEAKYNFCLSLYFRVKIQVFGWFYEIYPNSLLQFTARPINPSFKS